MTQTPVGIRAARITVIGLIGAALIGLVGGVWARNSGSAKQAMIITDSPNSTNTQVAGDCVVVDKPLPRVIPNVVQQKMMNVLKPLAGSQVRIDVVIGDLESRDIARQIQKIFEAAGWDTGNIAVVATANYRRVSMRIKDPQNYPLRAVRVQEALKMANLGFKALLDKKIGADEVVVCVGPEQ